MINIYYDIYIYYIYENMYYKNLDWIIKKKDNM